MKTKRASKGCVATVAYYGPNDQLATKAVVAIFSGIEGRLERLEKWHSTASDVREDARITQEIVKFVQSHHVRHVTPVDGIIGCPHEEGIDYPLGQYCPLCSFWKGRNRFTGQTKSP